MRGCRLCPTPEPDPAAAAADACPPRAASAGPGRGTGPPRRGAAGRRPLSARRRRGLRRLWPSPATPAPFVAAGRRARRRWSSPGAGRAARPAEPAGHRGSWPSAPWLMTGTAPLTRDDPYLRDAGRAGGARDPRLPAPADAPRRSPAADRVGGLPTITGAGASSPPGPALVRSRTPSGGTPSPRVAGLRRRASLADLSSPACSGCGPCFSAGLRRRRRGGRRRLGGRRRRASAAAALLGLLAARGQRMRCRRVLGAAARRCRLARAAAVAGASSDLLAHRRRRPTSYGRTRSCG